MKRKGKTFYKYLFSYLCIGLIPMLLNNIISYDLLYKYSNRQESVLKEAQIAHIEELIQQQISILNTIAIEISTENSFSNINLKDIKNFYDITEFLAEKKAMNNFIFDILYVDLKNFTVYTTNSIYQKEDFENNLYRYDQVSIMETVNNTSTGRLYFLPLSDVSRYGQNYQFITLTIPTDYIYTADGQKTSGAVIFLIQKETLETMIGASLQNENGINLLYYQNLLLYCSDTDFNWKLPSVSSLLQMPELSFENTTYQIFCNDDALDSFTLIELIPMNYLGVLSNVFFPSFTIVSVITIGICFFFVFFFMRVNYRPLRLLSLQALGKTNAEEEHPAISDDLKTIQNAMHVMSQKQDELILQNYFLLKEQCFYRLLDKNSFHDDIKKQFFLAGLPVDGPYYFLALFANQNEILELLEKNFPNPLQVYWNNTVIPEQIIFFAGGTKEALDYYIQLISSWKFDKGIGSVCNSFSELHDSYLSAQKNFYSCSGSGSSIPLSEIRSACKAIESGDYPRFVFLCRSISNNPVLFQNTEISIMVYSLLVGGVFSSLQSQKDIYVQNFFKLENKYINPPEVDKISQMIVSFADEINKAMQNTNNCRLTLQILLDYIGNNCFDIMFSIKGMADHFGTTPSNLSHFFKKKTGLSLSKHIQSLKISRAKELILSTNMPIKEIINIIGYTDSSSFIRLFKAETGMTPNEFRYSDFSMSSNSSVETTSDNNN